MLPDTIGIGLKPSHYEEILQGDHGLNWFELHPENFMGQGGLPHKCLSEIRADYDISMHGVGMSLGSAGGVNSEHLARLKTLVDRYQPAQVSEHIAWSHGASGIFHNDLLPLPYTFESMEILCRNIDQVQDALGRQILVENPSAYMQFEHSEMPEPQYIAEVQKRTGCGLLLDVNNVYVSGVNNEFDPESYLDDYPLFAVGEIHLAGHSKESIVGGTLLVDDHGSEVADDVWQLFQYVTEKLQRPVPTLIEWDTDVPEFSRMLVEVEKANSLSQASLAKPAKSDIAREHASKVEYV